MSQIEFYSELLKLDPNWTVKEVKIDETSLKVFVYLDFIGKQGTCPFTSELSTIYDFSPERKWRHLDTLQYQTWFVARVPRVRNKEGKISLIRIPWADFSDRYTMLFSNKIIELLLSNRNQTKTALFFNTSFDVIHSIMNKAVVRGLAQRSNDTEIKSIGIDEKSFKKGHKYCTIITDATNKRILEVIEGRTKEAAKKAINESMSEEQKRGVSVVTGDMWEAYQTAVKEELPKSTYVLDRFHLVKYLNIAIDKTRRIEVKTEPILKDARFSLLKNEQNLTIKQKIKFDIITNENYMVSHVWRAKQDFKAIFGQEDYVDAALSLKFWFNSIERITIKPLIEVKEMFKRHQIAITNALCHTDSNAYAERMNGSIQELKTIAKGFGNTKNYRTAILFHYGNLSLFQTLNFL